MKKLAIAMLGALALSGLVLGGAAAADKKAEPKKVAIKVIADDAKVRVFESTYAPGAENDSPPAANTRVVRALKAGELTRTYQDGKKEKVEFKANSVHVFGPSPAYSVKNTGKTTLQLYVVVIK